MSETRVEGELVFVQAMDQDQPQPEPRRAAASTRGPRHDDVPGVPKPDEVVRWVAAAFLAGAALLGLVVLASVLAFALDPPVWLQVVLGVVMAGGAVFFAWLVQSALSKDETQRRR